MLYALIIIMTPIEFYNIDDLTDKDWDNIKKLAIQLEILDDRDIFTRTSYELDNLHYRYVAYSCYPKLKNCAKYKRDSIGIQRTIDWLVAYKNHLEMKRDFEIFGNQLTREQIKEVESMLEFWHYIEMVNRNYSSIYNKRYALYEIKKIVGDENFSLGYTIPTVPYWQFVKSD